uniref:Transmembrane protein n=1 Tax=Glossina pallidipes TaxID=7398 RepID=A0A1A9Z794_GLOPL
MYIPRKNISKHLRLCGGGIGYKKQSEKQNGNQSALIQFTDREDFVNLTEIFFTRSSFLAFAFGILVKKYYLILLSGPENLFINYENNEFTSFLGTETIMAFCRHTQKQQNSRNFSCGVLFALASFVGIDSSFIPFKALCSLKFNDGLKVIISQFARRALYPTVRKRNKEFCVTSKVNVNVIKQKQHLYLEQSQTTKDLKVDISP